MSDPYQRYMEEKDDYEQRKADDDDFRAWQNHQGPDLLESMPLVEQAAHYASDEDWHNRKSDTGYLFRNN